jgi:SRSO17 transposase
VSLSLANHHASLPVAWRLYLPKEWAANHERRGKAGVPDEMDFKDGRGGRTSSFDSAVRNAKR